MVSNRAESCPGCGAPISGEFNRIRSRKKTFREWFDPQGHIITILFLIFLALFPFISLVPALLVLVYGLFQYLRRDGKRIATCPRCSNEIALTEASDTLECPNCRQNLLIQDGQRLWIE
jgi:DNA-directed RNA polymerase subunit RPC12/RpoP